MNEISDLQDPEEIEHKKAVINSIKAKIKSTCKRKMSVLKAEAILIDEELKADFDTRSDEEKETIRAVHLIFDKYDTNKDGMLSVNELEKYLNEF